MSDYTKISGGVCAPEGFLAGGVHCGIKKEDKDLALIMSEVPAVCAGVFTTNKVKAAPVRYSMQILDSGKKRAIIANSGCANCATGQTGNDAVSETVRKVAEVFSLSGEEIVVASTGSIGKQLPVEKICYGIDLLKTQISRQGGKDAALAIMTTDTFDKEISIEVPVGVTTIKIGGITKGAGMIDPHMATMLSFITTDAVISKKLLQQALTDATNQSFNRITVDGDMSTNDTVLLLANGKAGNNCIDNETGEDYEQFKQALDFVTKSLALMIVSDGEGATKLLEIMVSGAADGADAEKIASAVANSNLFKVAMFGQSPNWGRILSALGASGASTIEETAVFVYINDTMVVEKGVVLSLTGDKAKKLLEEKDITIKIDMGIDSGTYTVWTCDFSHEYIDVNV